MTAITRFEAADVRGYLHRPSGAVEHGLVLTHGAGGNCDAPVLLAAADAFVAAGLCVLRCDLPFRQKRPKGPPSPAGAATDRAGLRAAVTALRAVAPGRIFLGGHSYGGRQASMLAADDPAVAEALLLLSYPLHPPNKPDQLRTAHFPRLRVPALFVHGTKDPFGTPAELTAAIAAIPAPTRRLEIAGAGHDLKRGRIDFAPAVRALLDGLD
jgi:predicted alpha/beta-hydrolase family hydrolase